LATSTTTMPAHNPEMSRLRSLRADALSWQTATTTAFGVETNGKQISRRKRKTFPAQTFETRRARTCRARSQPWSEGGPSRQGKAIRAVQHGREVAPRPTPTIKGSEAGQRASLFQTLQVTVVIYDPLLAGRHRAVCAPYPSRMRRLSSMTRVPWQRVIGAPGQRLQAVR
jgi:hypothetical protein